MTDKIPVCIDFDGVLNEYEGWRGPNYMYAPRHGAREFLEILQEKGYFIIILTTRKPLCNIRRWFEKYQLPYDKITDKKLPAIAYIDDRGLKFNGDFRQTLHELEHFKTHWEVNND